MAEAAQQERTIKSDVPSRLDRLPWAGWHWRIITALGTSWLLDGLQVTLVGSLAGVLQSPAGLKLTDQQVSGAATVYLAGAVFGALLFGYLTDRLGRKRLFLVTLATYSLATLASAFSWNLVSFAIFRFFTGVGIGGEYAAINSAVDELIPGKVRGTVDLVVNGTFWVGGAGGAIAAYLLMQGHGISQNLGWRFAFGIGGALGLGVLFLRLFVPESPRWLMLRGKEEDARRVVEDIERRVSKGNPESLPKTEGEPLEIRVRDHTPLKEIFGNMLGENRARSLLGLVLMVAQSFFFNAVFFTYGLVVKKFFQVSDRDSAASFVAAGDWELSGATDARETLRQDWAEADDHGDLRCSGSVAGSSGGSLCHGLSGTAGFRDLSVGGVLYRFFGSECGLFDGERDLSAGDPGVCDCDFLCAWDACGRCRGAAAVWGTDCHWIAGDGGMGVRAGSASDAGGGWV